VPISHTSAAPPTQSCRNALSFVRELEKTKWNFKTEKLKYDFLKTQGKSPLEVEGHDSLLTSLLPVLLSLEAPLF
jgi:hypothetical protein